MVSGRLSVGHSGLDHWFSVNKATCFLLRMLQALLIWDVLPQLMCRACPSKRHFLKCTVSLFTLIDSCAKFLKIWNSKVDSSCSSGVFSSACNENVMQRVTGVSPVNTIAAYSPLQ